MFELLVLCVSGFTLVWTLGEAKIKLPFVLSFIIFSAMAIYLMPYQKEYTYSALVFGCVLIMIALVYFKAHVFEKPESMFIERVEQFSILLLLVCMSGAFFYVSSLLPKPHLAPAPRYMVLQIEGCTLVTANQDWYVDILYDLDCTQIEQLETGDVLMLS